MADVQSAFGGGAIGADGIGVEIGAALDGADLYYTRSTECIPIC